MEYEKQNVRLVNKGKTRPAAAGTVNSTGKGELPRERCIFNWVFLHYECLYSWERHRDSVRGAALVQAGESQLFVSLFFCGGFLEKRSFTLL